MSDKEKAGALLFVGAAQFLFALVVAEALYPGYSVSANTISALGVGPSALVFNASIIIFGALAVAAAFFLKKALDCALFPALVALAGFGAAGVGIFTSHAGFVHAFVSFVAFFFGALAAIAACRIEKRPLNYFSVVLGVVALAALGLYGAQAFLGLGIGGMERLVAYPIIIWVLGFGAWLLERE
ncbi:MAG: DUF998 domain-containing protein [Candidatus Micrarchaeota archaeon]